MEQARPPLFQDNFIVIWRFFLFFLFFILHIFVIVQLSLQLHFTAGHSCIRNNIINVPAPTLAEFFLSPLSCQHIESTKTDFSWVCNRKSCVKRGAWFFIRGLMAELLHHTLPFKKNTFVNSSPGSLYICLQKLPTNTASHSQQTAQRNTALSSLQTANRNATSPSLQTAYRNATHPPHRLPT